MIQTIDGRRYVSPQEAAQRYGLSTSTLAGRRCRGLAPGYYVCGSRIRYDVAELEDWLIGERHGGSRD